MPPITEKHEVTDRHREAAKAISSQIGQWDYAADFRVWMEKHLAAHLPDHPTLVRELVEALHGVVKLCPVPRARDYETYRNADAALAKCAAAGFKPKEETDGRPKANHGGGGRGRV